MHTTYDSRMRAMVRSGCGPGPPRSPRQNRGSPDVVARNASTAAKLLYGPPQSAMASQWSGSVMIGRFIVDFHRLAREGSTQCAGERGCYLAASWLGAHGGLGLEALPRDRRKREKTKQRKGQQRLARYEAIDRIDPAQRLAQVHVDERSRDDTDE